MAIESALRSSTFFICGSHGEKVTLVKRPDSRCSQRSGRSLLEGLSHQLVRRNGVEVIEVVGHYVGVCGRRILIDPERHLVHGGLGDFPP